MLIVSGTISLDPANHDAALAAVGPLVQATLAEEGNVSYGFWVHPDTRGEFLVYEEWADQDALDAHFVTPHMAEFMGAMADLGVTGTNVIRHEVTDSTKLM
jgi:quinol monooxygenase YgiN